MKRVLLAAAVALATTLLSHPVFAFQTRTAPAYRAPAIVFGAQPRMMQQRFYVRQRPVARVMRASRVRAAWSAPGMYRAMRPGSAARAALVGGPIVGAGFVGTGAVAAAPFVGAVSADTLEERNASWAKAWEIVSRNGGKVTKDCDEHCSFANTGFDNRGRPVFMQIDRYNDGTYLRDYCHVAEEGNQRNCTNWDTSEKRVFYWIKEEEAWRVHPNGAPHLHQQEAEEFRPKANVPTYAPSVETATFPIVFDCNANNAGDPAFKTEISVPVVNGSGQKPIAIRYGSISLTGTVNFADDGSVTSINAFGLADGQARELTLTPNLHDDQRVFLSGKLQPPGDSLMGRYCEATYYIADVRGTGRNSGVAESAPSPAAHQSGAGDKQRDVAVDESLELVGQCYFVTHSQLPSVSYDKEFRNDCSKMRIVSYRGNEHQMSLYVYNNVGIESRRFDGFMFYDPMLKHKGIMVQSVTVYGRQEHRVERGFGSCTFTVDNSVMTYVGCDLRYLVGGKGIDQVTESIAFNPTQQNRN